MAKLVWNYYNKYDLAIPFEFWVDIERRGRRLRIFNQDGLEAVIEDINENGVVLEKRIRFISLPKQEIEELKWVLSSEGWEPDQVESFLEKLPSIYWARWTYEIIE